MEIAHSVILELKVGPRITAADKAQLSIDVRAKTACGMHVKKASVVCFRDDESVEFCEVYPQPIHAMMSKEAQK